MNGTELVFNKSQHSYMPFSSLELSFYRHPEKSYWSMCLNSSFFCMNTPRSQYKLVFLFWVFFLIFDTSLFFFFLLSFKYNCLHFHPTLPISASHPQTHPLWLCPCVLHTCSLMASSIIPCYPSPCSCLVAVTLFFNSMSLVVFCLHVAFQRVIVIYSPTTTI